MLALLGVHTSGYQIPALPVANWVALGKLLTSWDDGFLMVRVRIRRACTPGAVIRILEITHLLHLERRLAHRKYLIHLRFLAPSHSSSLPFLL